MTTLKLEPVERYVLDGLARKVQTKLDLMVVWGTADDEIQVLKKSADNKVRYPYGMLRVERVEIPQDRGSLQAASVRGKIAVVPQGDTPIFFRVHYLPCTFTVRLRAVYNSYSDVLSAAKTLLFCSKNGWLKFSVAYGATSFDVGVMPEQSVELPSPTSQSESAKEYAIENRLTVNGYVSHSELLEGQMVTKLQLAALLDSPDTTPAWTSSNAGTTPTEIRFLDLPANLR